VSAGVQHVPHSRLTLLRDLGMADAMAQVRFGCTALLSSNVCTTARLL